MMWITLFSFVIFLFQGDCWICVEMMDISLDKFYKYIFNVLQSTIPEEILGKITVAVSMNIDFLLN